MYFFWVSNLSRFKFNFIQNHFPQVYFYPTDHIKLASFKNDIILLDLLNNNYFILPSEIASILRFLISTEFNLKDHNYCPINETPHSVEELQEYIDYFTEKKYLLPVETNIKYPVDLSPNNKIGPSNIDWRINYDGQKHNYSIKDFVLAYWILIKVCFVSAFFSFQRLVAITDLKYPSKYYYYSSKEQDKDLAYALNRACFYFPFRIKCLEWAVAYTHLAHRNQWRCNLQIGAQNIPFMAHAWVKTHNGVVEDDPTLPKSLAVLVNHPFEENEL